MANLPNPPAPSGTPAPATTPAWRPFGQPPAPVPAHPFPAPQDQWRTPFGQTPNPASYRNPLDPVVPKP